MVMQVMFLGPAGSGKTSLTAKFGEWILRNEGLTVTYVNLDPGCLNLPYKPDFDVRRYFTVRDLMERENLGPNGAMVKASELMQKNIKLFLNEIELFNGEFRLIDTPGQSEIFVFRPAGPYIAKVFSSKAPTIGVFLVDPLLAETPTSLASVFSLVMASQLRLGIPLITVLNKSDEVKDQRLERMIVDYNFLREEIAREGAGAITDLAISFVEVLEKLSVAQRLVKVSAKTGEGMNELFGIIHESLCECGDLT